MHLPPDAKPSSRTSRFVLPLLALAVAVVVILVVVLLVVPSGRNENLQTFDASLPTAAPSTSSTSSTTTSSTIPPTVATATLPLATSTTTPPTLGPGTGPGTTSTPPSQLFADNFAADAVGSAPAGWSIESGTWRVVADKGVHGVEGVAPSGQEGLISTGSNGWTNVTVRAAVHRDPKGAAGLGARYRNASNHYYCKFDGGHVVIGRVVEGVRTVLGRQPLTSEPTAMAFTVTGTTLQCAVGRGTETTSVSATDSTFSAGRMGLFQEEPAQFALVQVTTA